MTVLELEFYKIEGDNAPSFTCNNCGVRGKSTGWLMADIPLDGESSDTVSVVICSDQCLERFRSTSGVDGYLAALVETVTGIRAGM